MIVNDDVKFEMARRRHARKTPVNYEMMRQVMQTFSLQEIQQLFELERKNKSEAASGQDQ